MLKKPNKWVEFVMKMSKKLGMKYNDALKDPRVKEAYRSKKK